MFAPSLAGRAGDVRGAYLALLVVLGLRFKIFLDSLPIAWQVDASCPMVRSVHIQQSFHIANRHGICLDDLRHTRAFIITLLPNKLGTDDKTSVPLRRCRLGTRPQGTERYSKDHWRSNYDDDDNQHDVLHNFIA